MPRYDGIDIGQAFITHFDGDRLHTLCRTLSGGKCLSDCIYFVEHGQGGSFLSDCIHCVGHGQGGSVCQTSMTCRENNCVLDANLYP